MELRQYLTIFRRHFLAIIIFSLAGAAIAISWAARLPSGFKAEQLFFIVPPKAVNNDLYNFQGYFGQEKARNATDTAVAILASSDFVKLVPPSAAITARKIAPQVISIAATTNQEGSAANLLEKAALIFNQKMVDLTEGDYAIQLKAVGTNPSVASAAPNKVILAVGGFVAGLTFALFVVGLKNYFKL